MAANIIVACVVLHNIRFRYNLMNHEIDIDEAAAQQRAILPDALQICNRIRAQAKEINGADEGDIAHLWNCNDRLTEARRVQRRILRNQFGLR